MEMENASPSSSSPFPAMEMMKDAVESGEDREKNGGQGGRSWMMMENQMM